MKERTRGSYVIAGREVVADGADLRVTILTLASGQCVPWHSHSETSDSFFCMEGPMVVETRAPDASYVLKPGERCTVGPMRSHYVHGQDDGPCKFLLVQGVGVYDWVPDGAQ
jgi:quercetin dioxygenase-like cupin family protein